MPRPPSLKQKRFIDRLAMDLGFRSGKAFMADWTRTSEKLIVWEARTVHKAIEEALRRLKLQAKWDRQAKAATRTNKGNCKPGSS